MGDLKIKHQFISVEHPQANGQLEAANKVILAGLKLRLQGAKASWADELSQVLWVDELPQVLWAGELFQVLWAYRTTPHSTTGESPFRLAYGMEAMILIEITEESLRVMFYNEGVNNQTQKEELDLLPEV
ncbi:uncharacterized protein LOC107607749 [Arachis ipaensis]|uniref:uncharacterized protein LOC107607749 n=1 Tax=Arachis ipaensis TaxID=130454 RepID=UPI0007AFA1BF|nr:uncharacterized protein LOC107607749 [Arachis ipaensis]XP_025665177.1 uncharacterized protein LOC112763828 [Arachis hypogaea]